MDKANILAHRGYWKDAVDKNTFSAIKMALKKGYGIETDVRDLDGQLVISHDPPTHINKLLFSDFTNYILETKTKSRIALNIKSDGLQEKINHDLNTKFNSSGQFYSFDMSVPDTLSYRKISFPFYFRVSEYENEYSLINGADGAWVDSFTDRFDQIKHARKILEMGKRAAVVSPELHGRNHWPIWEKIKNNNLHQLLGLELCTDLPDEAYKYFCEDQ